MINTKNKVGRTRGKCGCKMWITNATVGDKNEYP